LFAATEDGVFLSTDNGTSWAATGLTNAFVSALAISPNGAGGANIFAGTIYTGVSNGGIFLSTEMAQVGPQSIQA